MTLRVAALYLRTSTSMQSKGMESQERALRAYCSTNGISNTKIYRDEGISGVKASRPQLDLMMEEVRKGQISTVIVYSFSRFARSTQHLLSALQEFRSLSVGFVSVSEAIDTESALGKTLFIIISAISELEREILRERVCNGLANAKAKGVRLGRKRTRPSHLIREFYSQGYSYRKIAKLCKCSTWSVAEEIKELKRLELEAK